jgi:membrane protein DedA with SNARE-associated domain
MTVEQLIDQYGYLAILIGTFLEGETVLVLGGLAAQLGHLQLSNVIVAAFLGSFLGDQLYFFLGRTRGKSFIDRRPQWHGRIERMQRLLDRWGDGLVIGIRFLYGLRIAGPFLFGMGRISPLRFVILNMAGAALWASVVATLGFLFGHVAEWVFGDLEHYSMGLFVGVLVLAVAIWLVHRYRSRRAVHPN